MLLDTYDPAQNAVFGKTFSQALRGLIVSREKLIARLFAERYKKLITLFAPAGFGKTTVIREFLSVASDSSEVISLVCDTSDDDAASFLYLLLEKLRETDPLLVPPSQVALEELTSRDSSAFLRALSQNIAMRSSNLYLVIDDYQNSANKQTDALLSSFILHSPDNLHFIIASRTVPALPLATLRVKDQLLEIKTQSLSFSAPEGEAFFRKIKGLVLSNQDVQRIMKYCEGWAAGLQLIGEAIIELGSSSRTVMALDYSKEYLHSYFEEEVLAGVDEELQNFLFRAGLLSQFNQEVLSAILQTDNCRFMLEELQRRQLFVYTANSQGHWLRFHALFASYIQDRMSVRFPEEKKELQLRAVAWFKENGYAHLAVPILAELGNTTKAAELINELFTETRELDFPLIYQWVNYFPGDTLKQNPLLLCQMALSGSLLGRTGNAKRLLEIAAEYLEHNAGHKNQKDYQDLKRLFAITRGLILCESGEHAEGSALLLDSLENLDPFHKLRVIIYAQLAHAHFSAGDLERCLSFSEDAIACAWEQDAFDYYCRAVCEKGMILLEQGNLSEAYDHFEKAFKFSRKHNLPEYTRIQASMGLWEIAHERMEPISDEPLISYGEIFTEQPPDVSSWTYTVYVGLRLVRFLAEKNMIDLATFCIDHVRSKDARGLLNVELYGSSIMGEFCLWRKTGDRARIKGWVASALHQYEAKALGLSKTLLLGVMLVYLAQYDTAVGVLSTICEESRSVGRFDVMIKAFVQLSHANSNLGRAELARDNLLQALLKAQDGGYKHVFVEQGQLCQRHLLKIREEYPLYTNRYGGLRLTYLDEVLAAFKQEDDQRGARTGPRYNLPEVFTPLYVSLSSREKEVLRLIAEDMRAKDIAETMTVSLATAKTHIRNIYRKLGVHNRREAVHLARSLISQS